MADLTLTRRGFATAGAAALGVAVAGVSVAAQAAAADPDAALVALIAQHAEASAALASLDATADALRARFDEGAPPRPQALLWRRSDFTRTSYGVGASDPIGDTDARCYDIRGVQWLRKAQPGPQWPPAAEARRREIVEAFDGWMAERFAHSARIGLTAANAASDRQFGVVADIEQTICGFAPTTLQGLRLKARWIASSPQADIWAALLLRDLCGASS